MIWLFDLDNTLYPYSTGMYQHINTLMNLYLEKKLKISMIEVDYLRKKYIQLYGTTLQGMMVHHQTDPTEFLTEIHSFNIGNFLNPQFQLYEFLQNLSGKKYIFTNSPNFYAKKVLKTLEIDSNFEDIFSIETFHYLGKPNPNAYTIVINNFNKEESFCLVDDEPANILYAQKIGMKTCFVDSKKKDLTNYYEDEFFPKVKGIK